MVMGAVELTADRSYGSAGDRAPASSLEARRSAAALLYNVALYLRLLQPSGVADRDQVTVEAASISPGSFPPATPTAAAPVDSVLAAGTGLVESDIVRLGVVDASAGASADSAEFSSTSDADAIMDVAVSVVAVALDDCKSEEDEETLSRRLSAAGKLVEPPVGILSPDLLEGLG
jgi:hypothetical protein